MIVSQKGTPPTLTQEMHGSGFPAANGLLFEVGGTPHYFHTNGSRLYGLTDLAAAAIAAAIRVGDERGLDDVLARYGLDAPLYITDAPPEAFPTRALSLAIAQKCNLGCTYCYAAGGGFGGPAVSMPTETATAAIRMLIDGTPAGERVTIGYLGGEPLANRAALVAATEFAASHAAERGVDIGFSITTNGTLVTPEDVRVFERYGFAVTVSLDGIGEVHDEQRSFRNGVGSYARIIDRIAPLLAASSDLQVSARVTVTPRNLKLHETLDGLIDLGFDSVGFSPMLSSPNGRDEMDGPDLRSMLDQMIDCGRSFERRLAAGERFPFANIVNALAEIHRGTHRPYPCGAGGPYLGVSAEGGLFACHRFVDDEAGAFGDIGTGIDAERQADWLATRHVDRQEPCRSCWARYLCGGGCHHEVIHRGRPACDYIRGWLTYCLQAYLRLIESRPDYFEPRGP